MCLDVDTCPQRLEEGIESHGAGLQVVLGHLMYVLGTQLPPFARAAGALNCCDISTVSKTNF